MRIYFLTVLLLVCIIGKGQDVPALTNSTPLSTNTEEESKLSAVPVNIFTGVPNVSVPIYNYSSSNGLSWPVSLDYFAGGAQVAEGSSSVGPGWYLNGAGVITRTVRGMPDDYPTNGYLYAPAIFNDSRSFANKYYYDSLDAEQDVFQFNFNGNTGKFMIGKNKQIIILPNSKIKITYTVSTADNASIVGFRIITEDGVKYDFTITETTSVTPRTYLTLGYSNNSYATAWFLTQMISPFNTDTVKFYYIPGGTTINGYGYPQAAFFRVSDGVRTSTYIPTANMGYQSWKLSSIQFPDKKTLNVVYNSTEMYTASDYMVSKIKIYDSVFRFGYALGYTDFHSPVLYSVLSTYLTSVTPYTSQGTKRGYSFIYNTPFVPIADTDYNKIDFWGFYNGAVNSTNNVRNQIPYTGTYPGAIRTPNPTYAVAGSLKYFYMPGGGYNYYEYELNDHYPYTKSPQFLQIAGNTNSQNNIFLSQVFSPTQQLIIKLDSTVARIGNAPVSGTGTWTLNIRSTDGSILYATYNISLFDLFFQGIKTWTFNVPNGTYMLQTLLNGSTVTGSFPVDISWENRLVDTTHTSITSGGLRVKRVHRVEANDDPNITTEEFQYLTEDGKSSGFFGDIPKYDYPYSETVINGTTTNTSYTAVNSQPLSTLDYAQGSPVGYSRVVVYKGTSTHNIGKTVYDFTGLADVNRNATTYSFPYAPQDKREWGLGLPKRISVYDTSGRLVKRTVNTYQIDTITYNSSNFASFKIGNTYTLYNGDPANSASPRTRTFLLLQYYPSSGRAYVVSTNDTVYQTDGSLNTSYKNYNYDTNYNVNKVTTFYDRTRSLQLETRLYHPYNYTIGGTVGKLRDSAIITPVIATENWITGDATPRIISGSITDYQQLSAGYVRPLTSYILQTNAPIPQSTIGLFDSSKLNRNTNYFVAQIGYPSYDIKGNLLQTKNLVSGLSSSVVMDYNNEYTIAKISNSAVTDVAYTSFESDGSGNWTIGSTSRLYTGALTGKLSYNLASGNISKSSLNTSLNYIISVWAKTGASVSVNGTLQTTSIAQQNGWNLYFTTVTGVSTITISGTGTIDELRLYPKDANMITTTYEPLVGATSVSDANNTVMYTAYDYLNRPKLIKDKDLNVLKRFDYSDRDSLINTNPNYSVAATFTWLNDTSRACLYDSTYTTTDINPWSDTYNKVTTRVVQGTNYCLCTWASLYPQAKIVNGVCEIANKQYSACVHKTDGYYCTYHWIWSDCSKFGSYSEIDSTPRTVTTGCIVP